MRLLAGLALIGAGPPSPASPVSYTLAPVMTGNQLTAVEVQVRFKGDASGRTALDLPGDFGGVKDHWRYIYDLTAQGAAIRPDGDAKRILVHRPNAPVTLVYRVKTAYASDPDAKGGNAYDGAVIRPRWFASLGEFLFAMPKGREKALATFAWRDWPRSWMRVSDADHGGMGRAMTAADVVESTLLAGPDVELRTRAVDGGVLRLASRGHWAFGLDGYADTMAQVIGAERRFWGDAAGPFTVTMLQLAANNGRSSSGGTGRGDAFAQYASSEIPEAGLIYNIAHEHKHSWTPRRIGEMPDKDEASVYWLSEGFTDFYAARLLLRSGVWTPAQFVGHLNGKLAAYTASPARTYANARIGAGFWTDPAVEQLPYQRGELFAYLLDQELRRASGGKTGIDQLLFAMRDRWAAAPANAKPPLLANFVEANVAAGFDVGPMLARYIDAGQPIDLPSDAFAGCARVATVSIPVFDIGFDRAKTAETGLMNGVDPAGPAYAAGIRNGMRRLARLGGRESDSRVTLSYRVADASGERVIAYRPEGKSRLALQEVSLSTGLTADQLKRCARLMSGDAVAAVPPMVR